MPEHTSQDNPKQNPEETMQVKLSPSPYSFMKTFANIPIPERVLKYFTDRDIPEEAIPLFFIDFHLFEMGGTMLYEPGYFTPIYNGLDFILSTLDDELNADFFKKFAKIVAQERDLDEQPKDKCGQFKYYYSQHHLFFNALPRNPTAEDIAFFSLSVEGLPEFLSAYQKINRLAKHGEFQYHQEVIQRLPSYSNHAQEFFNISREEQLSLKCSYLIKNHSALVPSTKHLSLKHSYLIKNHSVLDPSANYLSKVDITTEDTEELKKLFNNLIKIYPNDLYFCIDILSKGQKNTTLQEILFNNLVEGYKTGGEDESKNKTFNLKNLFEFIRNAHITHFTHDMNGRMIVFLLRFRELIKYNQQLPLTLSSYHFAGYSLEEMEKEHLDGIELANEFSLKKANEIIKKTEVISRDFRENVRNSLSKRPLVACIQLNALFVKSIEQNIKNELILLYSEKVEELVKHYYQEKQWNPHLLKQVYDCYNETSGFSILSPKKVLYHTLSKHVIFFDPYFFKKYLEQKNTNMLSVFLSSCPPRIIKNRILFYIEFSSIKNDVDLFDDLFLITNKEIIYDALKFDNFNIFNKIFFKLNDKISEKLISCIDSNDENFIDFIISSEIIYFLAINKQQETVNIILRFFDTKSVDKLLKNKDPENVVMLLTIILSNNRDFFYSVLPVITKLPVEIFSIFLTGISSDSELKNELFITAEKNNHYDSMKLIIENSKEEEIENEINILDEEKLIDFIILSEIIYLKLEKKRDILIKKLLNFSNTTSFDKLLKSVAPEDVSMLLKIIFDANRCYFYKILPVYFMKLSNETISVFLTEVSYDFYLKKELFLIALKNHHYHATKTIIEHSEEREIEVLQPYFICMLSNDACDKKELSPLVQLLAIEKFSLSSHSFEFTEKLFSFFYYRDDFETINKIINFFSEKKDILEKHLCLYLEKEADNYIRDMDALLNLLKTQQGNIDEMTATLRFCKDISKIFLYHINNIEKLSSLWEKYSPWFVCDQSLNSEMEVWTLVGNLLNKPISWYLWVNSFWLDFDSSSNQYLSKLPADTSAPSPSAPSYIPFFFG